MMYLRPILALILAISLLVPVFPSTTSAVAPECAQILNVSLPEADDKGVRQLKTSTDQLIELAYEVTPNMAATREREPIDLILVAETAETMAQDFDGNEYDIQSTNPNQRINAMKDSLRKFNKLISEINQSKTEKDRVSLIEFDRSARVKIPLTQNYASIDQSIQSLKAADPQDITKRGKNFGHAFSLAANLVRQTQQNIPKKPLQLNGQLTTNGEIQLEWQGSLNSEQLKHYELFRSKNSMFNYSKIVETIDTNFLDADIDVGANYDYYVIAVDRFGVKSPPSDVFRITTLPDLNAPTSPANLKISAITNDSALISWSASIDNSGIREYQVFIDNELVGTTKSLNYKLNDLIADREYNVHVRAVDLSGKRSSVNTTVKFRTINKRKLSFLYELDTFSVPELQYRALDSKVWQRERMDVSEVIGIFRKHIFVDPFKPYTSQFEYIDNAGNYFPNNFEAYQPRRKKINQSGKLVKEIGSNPKPILVTDDSVFSASNSIQSDHHFISTINKTRTFKHTYRSPNVRENLDSRTDVLPDATANTFTVYYKSGGVFPQNAKQQPFKTPYIYYSIDGKDWTIKPGIPMNRSNIAGYHYITIQLGEENQLQRMAFNNGQQDESNRIWQNDNGNFFAGDIKGRVMVYDPTQNKLVEENPNTSNLATVYYKSNRYESPAKPIFFQNPFIHYSLDGKQWTKYPGESMQPSIVAGYHFITIDLGEETSIDQVVFSDGNTIKDEQNGQRFKNKFKRGSAIYDPEKQTIINQSPLDSLETQNVANIYYKSDELYPSNGMSAFANPHIHFSLGNNVWTRSPGVPMVASSITGYHTIIVPLGKKQKIPAVTFSDGIKNWQNNNGNNYSFDDGTSVFYSVEQEIIKGTPRQLISRRVEKSTHVPIESQIMTVYYQADTVHSIELPYLRLNTKNIKDKKLKMMPSEWKGFYKVSFLNSGESNLRLDVVNEKNTIVQSFTNEQVLLADTIVTLIPSSTAGGKLIKTTPPNYEPDSRKKIVIFLSDGLPNISPQTGDLEGNGDPKTVDGQRRENPFVGRLGYAHARDELEKLVALGTQVHVIAIGSDNAVNIDTAAIDLTFLEYIASLGKGDFFRAEDAEQVRIRLKEIGSQVTLEKLSNVEIRQKIPSGIRLPGGATVVDVEVNGELFDNAAKLVNNELIIRLNEVTLDRDTSYKVKIKVQAQHGGIFKLSPVQLNFPYLDRLCKVTSGENHKIDADVVVFDRFANKYVGKTNGEIIRYASRGKSTGYPESTRQWSLRPYQNEGESLPVKSIRFSAEDTTIRVEHHNSNLLTTWNLLPTSPEIITLKAPNNQLVRMTKQNLSVLNMSNPTLIMDVEGAGLALPVVGSTPVAANEMTLGAEFSSQFISAYEYSMNNGQSWSRWVDNKPVAFPNTTDTQTITFRALTDSISGNLIAGSELSGTFKYKPSNKPPTIEMSRLEQPKLVTANVEFANKKDDLLVDIRITDDKKITDNLKVNIDGKSISSKLWSVSSTNEGKIRTITLQWSKLFTDTRVRQGKKKIEVMYTDEDNLSGKLTKDVSLNVGAYVRTTNSVASAQVTNIPVTVRVDWQSYVPQMKLSTAEYLILNRPITYRGATPQPTATGWKKLGSKNFTVTAEGISYIYIRVRDQENLSSLENGYSPINKRNPIIVRINYKLNRQ